MSIMVELSKIYKRNFLNLELGLSILLGLGAIWLLSFVDLNSWLQTNRTTIYSLIATISTTLLGFVITGVSVLIAFSESEKLKLLRESAQFETIFIVYFSTIKFLAITALLSIFGIIFSTFFQNLILYLVVWSIIISSLRIYRCLWVLENIVKIFHKKGEGEASK